MRTMDAAAQAQLGFLIGNLTYVEQEVLRQPYGLEYLYLRQRAGMGAICV